MNIAAQNSRTNAREKRPTPLEVLELKATVRAYLASAGELDFHDAVDECQAFAERVGLVDEIGQDAVQNILSIAFAPYRGGAHV